MEISPGHGLPAEPGQSQGNLAEEQRRRISGPAYDRFP